jgi:hypothetical protein
MPSLAMPANILIVILVWHRPRERISVGALAIELRGCPLLLRDENGQMLAGWMRPIYEKDEHGHRRPVRARWVCDRHRSLLPCLTSCTSVITPVLAIIAPVRTPILAIIAPVLTPILPISAPVLTPFHTERLCLSI